MNAKQEKQWETVERHLDRALSAARSIEGPQGERVRQQLRETLQRIFAMEHAA